jgi:hypothetical protein
VNNLNIFTDTCIHTHTPFPPVLKLELVLLTTLVCLGIRMRDLWTQDFRHSNLERSGKSQFDWDWEDSQESELSIMKLRKSQGNVCHLSCNQFLNSSWVLLVSSWSKNSSISPYFILLCDKSLSDLSGHDCIIPSCHNLSSLSFLWEKFPGLQQDTSNTWHVTPAFLLSLSPQCPTMYQFPWILSPSSLEICILFFHSRFLVPCLLYFFSPFSILIS